MHRAKLLVPTQGTCPTELVLGALASIGRAPGNSIVLDDPRVSRHHTVVRQTDDGTYVVSDLGSANGTWLNGRRVLLPERLRDGDTIAVGGTELTFLEAPRAVPRVPSDDDITVVQAGTARDALQVIGTASAMADVFRLMSKAAASTIAVLIEGETGTGKELVARAIHAVSDRRDAPMVAVNCAALPETLLESQLFGHRRGSFTGADRDHVGLFEAATGGTVFLDEIGEMPLAMQAKLLRVLQEGEITPIGDTRPRRVDVRIISATNRDLRAEVAGHRFREDLFYRLAGFPIALPALRERREDIPLLAQRFLEIAVERHHKRVRGFTPDALARLVRFDWPGNVRELQNEVQRAVVLAEAGEAIAVAHLSPHIAKNPPAITLAPDAAAAADNGTEAAEPPGGVLLRDARAAFEAGHIARVLEEQGGNVSRAAAALGLSRMQLHRKLKEYGLR